MKEFRDKVLVVTGGSSGIGQAIAKEGALRGMKVVFAGFTKAHVDETLKILSDLGCDAKGLVLDLTEKENIQKLFDVTMESYGRVDMLCNNAGVASSAPIWDLPDKDIEWLTSINYLSHLYGMKIFIPQMIRQGTEAEIVNTESTAGIMTTGSAVMYHSTKFAGVAASESTYLALRQRGLSRIHVHCLMPAFIQTRVHETDRDRPERFAIDDDPFYQSEEYLTGIERSTEQVTRGMPIDYVGKCVFTAVEEERFYIFTHPESQMAAGMRIQRMVNGENPQ
ncbi:MAG: SDR family NAD(P)-dependent oxidoreductase [Lachnospiraceae bacterium]|jgi:NAD(P)-dependent dehydrogenase (short-subunit alcohol dehydrogenase family)